ncbi:MAG: ABC transporter permease, partial [Planctomycetota bacterium]|nr:ABC transporter permease [Planctomycetota bacterium]
MKHPAVLLRLAVVPNLQRRARTAVAVLGIAVSVALVVWNLRGFTIARERAVESARQSGRFDVAIVPKDFRGAQLDPAVIKEVGGDEAVAEIEVSVKTRVRLLKPDLPPLPGPFGKGGPSGGITVIGTGATEPPQGIAEGRWLSTAANEAVVSSQFRERCKLRLGDELVVAGMGAERTLKVVGVASGAGAAPVPGMRMMPPPHLADVYVSPATAGAINGYTDRPNLVCIALKDSGAAEEFASRWRDRLDSANPPAVCRMLKTLDDPFGFQPSAAQQMVFANATILAFLTAVFIIFVTLSANVRERLRQFAILRALAMSRSQLVFMVLVESLLFALAGWAAGMLLIKAFLACGSFLSGSLAIFQPDMFSDRPTGATVWGIAAGCAVAGALAAATIPAWNAARVEPADILGGRDGSRRRAFPWAMVAAGLILVAVNPAIVVLGIYSEPVRSALSRFWGWGPPGFGAPLAGSLAMIIGFGLVSPLAVLAAERVLGPLIGWTLGLDRRFLRQQLTSNLWRATGTTVALSAGLALFATSLVWGYSMLAPFTPDRGLPRMQIAIMPAGVPESAADEVRVTPGIKAEECVALAVEQPRLTEEMLKSPAFSRVEQKNAFTAQQHMLFIGVDPQRAFGSDRPLFNLNFVEGSAAEAAGKLAQGRFCVVPQEFSTRTGLKVGDSFSLEVPNVRGKQVTYTIAGIASVPGWNWLTKFSEVRRRAIRALAIVFADYRQVKADFALDRVNYFWANVEDGVAAEELEKRLEAVAKRYAGVGVNVPQVGETLVGSQYVRVTDRENVIEMLLRRGNDVIWSLTWLPLITLAISSLAVFNAIVASVRARFWQIGV